MAYNPPDTRDGFKDTLYCLNVAFEYQREDRKFGHVWCFQTLEDPKMTVEIFNPSKIKINKKLIFGNLRDAQKFVIKQYDFKV